MTEEIQLARLMARNQLDEKEARARIASQLPMSVKEQGADAVIYNNTDIEATANQLQIILKDWDVI